MERNLPQKIILILAVVVVGILLIYPPEKRLRPGLDIAGGVALIFEIDDTGLEGHPNLAEEMKLLLQRRADPKGVYDLTWRVHGRNRLEVQMPLPPANITKLRRDYSDALERLFAAQAGRGAVQNALALRGPERDEKLNALARGSAERLKLLQACARAHDVYLAALEAYRAGTQAPATQPVSAATPVAPANADQPAESAAAPPAEDAVPPAEAVTPAADAATQPAPEVATPPTPTREELESNLSEAEAALEDAYDAFLQTNIDRNLFQETLDLDEKSPIRRNSLKELKDKHPDLAELIDDAVRTHTAWREHRGDLDGPADLQRLLRGAGVLEFRILPQPTPENEAMFERYRRQLEEYGPRPMSGDEYGWFKVDNPISFFDRKSPADLAAYDLRQAPFVAAKRGADYYVLASLSEQEGLLGVKKTWQLKNARRDRDQHGRWCVDFELDIVGGALFEDLTSRNIGRPLCILLDNVAYSAPSIQTKIRTRGQITGDFSLEKATYLAQTMQGGALPARLKETPISERTIGSSLGATNRDLAFRSGVIGLVAVGVFMAVYYTYGGLIANAAMVLNVVLVLAIMALLQARFTLAGIAGMILTIGVSIDANVLIFERMREEKARGSSLRQVIKNGYDKAFSVILDANLTTILTCVILYYVGSEEVKGFGLTLGWGVAMSMFTALFVTRTVFTLLIKYGWLKSVPMLHLISVWKVDWYAWRKLFIPLSLVLSIVGLGLLFARGHRDYLDVEFLGGISAEVEVREARPGEAALDDVKIGARLREVAESLKVDADRLAQVQVDPGGTPNEFLVRAAGLDADRLAAMIAEPLEDARWLQRGGLERHARGDALLVRLVGDRAGDQLRDFIRALPPRLRSAADNIAGASVGSVMETVFGDERGRFWSITTTEQNKRLVQHALEVALGDRLQRQQRVRYEFRGAGGDPWPIPGRAQRLEDVITDPTFPSGISVESLPDFAGGAALYFDNLQPPQSVEPDVAGSVTDRLRNMRLQPGFQDYPFRKAQVIGVRPAGRDENGRPLYSSVVVLVVDENYRYADGPELWRTQFAAREQELAMAALDLEQSLRKVSQFKPQIAHQASQQAGLAIFLSWLVIIGYMWVRFGKARYGVAGVVALIHDVCMALAFVGIAGWIAKLAVGRALLIDDFKINMTIVAAVLTIIGYSINDTIVVFDRIRELRGRLGRVTPQVVNDAINQCMSRTILTALTVWMVLLVMYIFGGSSIRGFNYCMLIGTLTGCYSSIAIAAPLLLVRLGGKPATEGR